MKINLKRIEYEMETRKWSKLRLSIVAGISRQTLWNILNDPGKFHPETVCKIADAFDIQAKDLLS